MTELPRLIDNEWSLNGVSFDPIYNCMAWAVDRNDVWYQPINDVPAKNEKGIDQNYGRAKPNGVLEIRDVDNFFFKLKGWKRFTPGAREGDGVLDAEVLYYHDEDKTTGHNKFHAARNTKKTMASNRLMMYESKLGKGWRIEHVWDQLNDGPYGARGKPDLFYGR